LFPPAFTRVAHSAAVHRDRHAGRVRRQGARGGRWTDGPGRRDAAGNRAGISARGRPASQEVERARAAHARSTRGGTQEARSWRSSQEIPVQQAVINQILTPLDLALGPFGVEREMRAAAETTRERE